MHDKENKRKLIYSASLERQIRFSMSRDTISMLKIAALLAK